MTSAIDGIALDDSYTYPQLPGRTHRLVPVVISVLCDGIPPDKRVVQLHTNALPFGLLEGVTVKPERAGDAQVPFRVHLMKTSGRRVSGKVEHRDRVSVVFGEMGNTEDAAHPEVRAVKDKTGHVLAHRMLAASSIVHMGIEFYAAPPSKVRVQFHGANIVPADWDDDRVRAALAARKRVPFELPPLSARQRLGAATRVVRAQADARGESEADADAGAIDVGLP